MSFFPPLVFPSSPQKDALLQPRPVPPTFFCARLFYSPEDFAVSGGAVAGRPSAHLARQQSSRRGRGPLVSVGIFTAWNNRTQNSCSAASSARCSDVRIEYLVRPAGAKLLESAGWVCLSIQGTWNQMKHPGCGEGFLLPMSSWFLSVWDIAANSQTAGRRMKASLTWMVVAAKRRSG